MQLKIYLAGKMDAKDGAWRDALLGTEYDYEQRCSRPKWELVNRGGNFEVATESYSYGAVDPPDWPKVPNTHVLGLHDYVGPYRLTYPGVDAKYSGYFHGTTWLGQHGCMDNHRGYIVQQCIQAMSRADFIFAYLNSPDCFGTVAEIGMAHTLGKYVALVVDRNAHWDWDDYWFVHELVASSGDGDHLQCDPETDAMLPLDEASFIRDRFRDALVKWTARPTPVPSLSIVRPEQVSRDDLFMREIMNYGESFNQITRWTSDPRVRHEASRMVDRIRQVIGR